MKQLLSILIMIVLFFFSALDPTVLSDKDTGTASSSGTAESMPFESNQLPLSGGGSVAVLINEILVMISSTTGNLKHDRKNHNTTAKYHNHRSTQPQ